MRNNNSGSGLVKLLTILLITCAIAEAGIAAYTGVTMQINRQANAEAATRYEAYQEQMRRDQEEPAVIQYMGPGFRCRTESLLEVHGNQLNR